MVRKQVSRTAGSSGWIRIIRKFLAGGGSFGGGPVNPPPPPPPPEGISPIISEDETLLPGELARLLSAAVQEPDRADAGGNTVLDFHDNARFKQMNIYALRYYAGSQSFTVRPNDVNGPDFRFVADDFLDAFPDTLHDVTFAPQMNFSSIADLYHDRVNTFVLGNEPPNNVAEFNAVGGYTVWAKAAYQAAITAGVPAEKIFIQGGKPEFFDTTVNPLLLVYPPPPTLAVKHSTLFNEWVEAVSLGELPPRIVTTHKRADEETDLDLYPYYQRLIQYYIDAVDNPNLRVNFQEFKWKNFYGDNIHLLLYYVEMILLMSRLRYEFGDVIHGLTFQQSYTQPKGNLVDLFNPANPTDTLITHRYYNIGFIGEFFLLVDDVISNGVYVFSSRTPNPVGIEVEFYDYAGDRYAIYVNKGNSDVKYALDVESMISVSSDKLDKTSFDHVFTFSDTNTNGQMKAKTCGIIKLN